MKKCAVICEFNPFHNGHAYLLGKAREISGCDMLVCLMSPDFTQRGEAAVCGKYIRASHAVKNGADAVLQLPVAFAVSPAETFAAGSAHIIMSLGDVTHVAFGTECGDIGILKEAARVTGSGEFRERIRTHLADGEGFPRAAENAYLETGGKSGILDRPNNILATEYIRAFDALGFDGEYIAVKREGAGHGDTKQTGRISSSSAIRGNLSLLRDCAPRCVADDATHMKDLSGKLRDMQRLCVLRDGAGEIRRTEGCTEGLENAIVAAAEETADITAAVTSKRYSSSRINRILTANLLRLDADDTKGYLSSPLYVKPLAVRGDSADEILSDLGKGEFPLLVRGRDRSRLTSAADRCFRSDILSDSIYKALGGETEDMFTVRKI